MAKYIINNVHLKSLTRGAASQYFGLIIQQGIRTQDIECSMVLCILAQARVSVFKIGEFLHHYIINVCLRILRCKILTGISGILTLIFILFLKSIRNIVNIRKYGCSSTVCRYRHIAEKPHGKDQRRISP